MDFLDQLKPLIDWLHAHPGWAGVVTFLISLAESLAVVGLFIPGSVVMTAIGTLIGAGIIPGWQITAWAIAGAIVGDSISYRLGYHFNVHLREVWPFKRYPKILTTGETFFFKHGGKSVFLARFVGPMRPIIPVVAGMMKFSPMRFLISNVSSAFIWAPFYMIPGMLLGAATLELDPKSSTKLVLLVLGLLIITWFTAWLFKRLFVWLFKKIELSLNDFWMFLKKRPRYRLLCCALQDPRHPDHHGQLTLALSFLIMVSLFIALTIFTHYCNAFTLWDQYTDNFVKSFYNPVVIKIFIVITEAGLSANAAIVALCGIIYLFWVKRKRAALHYLSVILLVIVSVMLLKTLIESPRPDGLAIAISSHSYPSGHVTTSVAIYGFLAILLTRDMPSIGRFIVSSIVTLFCLLIMLSRLYLGAHWLTDVTAGLLLGLSILMVVTLSYRRKNDDALPFIGLLITSVIALILTVCVQLYLKYPRMVQQFAPIVSATSIKFDDWWHQHQEIKPTYRTNRIGKPVQIFNIEWADTQETIQKILLENGWEKLPNLTLISAINRLSSAGDDRLLPLIPQLNAGQQPDLILTKKLATTKDFLLVLRLWKSHVTLQGTTIPLWYGTINYQVPRGYRFGQAKQYKQILSQYKPAITELTPLFNQVCWQRIDYPPLPTLQNKTSFAQKRSEEVLLIHAKEDAKTCDNIE